MYTQSVRFQNLFPETLYYDIKKILAREINLEPWEKMDPRGNRLEENLVGQKALTINQVWDPKLDHDGRGMGRKGWSLEILRKHYG